MKELRSMSSATRSFSELFLAHQILEGVSRLYSLFRIAGSRVTGVAPVLQMTPETFVVRIVRPPISALIGNNVPVHANKCNNR